MLLNEEGTVRMCRILRHRLLNFVAGIKSANSLMADQLDARLTPREREYFAMIQKECDEISNMTNRFGAVFTALPDPLPNSLQNTIDNLMTDLQESHPMAKISMEFDERCKNPALLVCSRALQTAVHEAVSNAYESSRKPVSVIVVHTGQTCTIRVYDEGSALTDEMREMAFEPFYSTRPRQLGVGLSIALRLVTDRGGSMAIGKDQPGNYTEIILPYLQDDKQGE